MTPGTVWPHRATPGVFFAEFQVGLAKVCKNPRFFHFDASGLRKCNLDRFPYHFLYDIRGGTIRVWVLRHSSQSELRNCKIQEIGEKVVATQQAAHHELKAAWKFESSNLNSERALGVFESGSRDIAVPRALQQETRELRGNSGDQVHRDGISSGRLGTITQRKKCDQSDHCRYRAGNGHCHCDALDHRSVCHRVEPRCCGCLELLI